MPEPRRGRSVRPGDGGRRAAQVTLGPVAVARLVPDVASRPPRAGPPLACNVMHRLAAGHVFATGVFFRLEPVPVADE